jgi:hypothetical protein
MAGLRGKSKPREDQLNTAFTTTTKLSEATTKDILHTTAIDEELHFKVYEDTPVKMVQQIIHIAHQTGRTNLVRVVACEWMGKESTTAHLLWIARCSRKRQRKRRWTMSWFQTGASTA